jgi:hypothetical protein
MHKVRLWSGLLGLLQSGSGVRACNGMQVQQAATAASYVYAYLAALLDMYPVHPVGACQQPCGRAKALMHEHNAEGGRLLSGRYWHR